jgi:hypothetical protein
MAIISDKPGPHVINGTDYSDTIEANDGDGEFNGLMLSFI